jgi:hypothetical protein
MLNRTVGGDDRAQTHDARKVHLFRDHRVNRLDAVNERAFHDAFAHRLPDRADSLRLSRTRDMGTILAASRNVGPDSDGPWSLIETVAGIVRIRGVFVSRPLPPIRFLMRVESESGCHLRDTVAVWSGWLVLLRSSGASAAVVWRDWRHDIAVRKNAGSNQRPQQHHPQTQNFKED